MKQAYLSAQALAIEKKLKKKKVAGRKFYVKNTRFFLCYDLTASPASAIWILRIYSRMNIVIACPTARHVVIHPDIVHNLKFSLIPFPKREFLSIYAVSKKGILINSIQRTNMFFQTLYRYFSGRSYYQETLNDRNAS